MSVSHPGDNPTGSLRLQEIRSEQTADEVDHAPPSDTPRDLAMLSVGALGVVYGDIGTSPLYAIKECFGPAARRWRRRWTNVLGILSLVFWSLVLVVSVKYLIVRHARRQRRRGRHPGAARARRSREERPAAAAHCFVLSCSACSARRCSTATASSRRRSRCSRRVEGLEVATHAFEPFVVPITVRHPDRPVLRAGRGTARHRHGLRPDDAGLVPGDRGARASPAIAQHPEVLRAVEPDLRRHASSRAQRRRRVPRARRGRALHHRRRGAVRRHGPLRARARSALAWYALVFPALAAQLLRAGRAAPARRARRRSRTRSTRSSPAGRCTRWS